MLKDKVYQAMEQKRYYALQIWHMEYVCIAFEDSKHVLSWYYRDGEISLVRRVEILYDEQHRRYIKKRGKRCYLTDFLIMDSIELPIRRTQK